MCIYNSYFIYCSVNIFKLNVLHSHVRSLCHLVCVGRKKLPPPGASRAAVGLPACAAAAGAGLALAAPASCCGDGLSLLPSAGVWLLHEAEQLTCVSCLGAAPHLSLVFCFPVGAGEVCSGGDWSARSKPPAPSRVPRCGARSCGPLVPVRLSPS